MSRIFLAVPFNEKSKAKELGCWWSQYDKLWYIPNNLDDENKAEILDSFNKARDKIIYLNVKYDDKDDAKSHGARWDKKERRWYIPREALQYNYVYLLENYSLNLTNI